MDHPITTDDARRLAQGREEQQTAALGCGTTRACRPVDMRKVREELARDRYVQAQQKVEPGTKNDAGKARFDLIPSDAIREVAELYTMGANKYGDRNWENGMSWGRVFAAMLRHAFKWWSGEDNDPEDGQHHLTSVAWCALTLLTYARKGVGTDDRSHLGLQN